MVLRLSKITVISICAIFIIISQAEGRQMEKRRKEKSSGVIVHSRRLNICDITDRDSKVHCYCEENQAAQNASRAECWVFNGGMSNEDPIWAAFSSQTNLIELNFNVRADGGLSFVPTRSLHALRYLQMLTIKYANIDEVTSFAFANLTSLKEISMTRNKVVDIQENAFASLHNLTIINLDDNRITEIKRDCFYDLPMLQKLYITNNNISVLHDGAFKHLTQLITLELNRNSISILTRESFDGLANLKRLDLSNNRMNMIGDFTFAELWNLQDLMLDRNMLQFMSERAFDGLSQLKKLSLSENRLSTLTEGLFEGVRGLVFLDLRSNHLETLTFENIRPIIDNMKNVSSYVYLEGNSFECDCRLSWMHMLRNDTKSEKVRSSLEQVTCHLEPEFPNNQLLNDLQSKPSAQHSVKKQIIHQHENRIHEKTHNSMTSEEQNLNRQDNTNQDKEEYNDENYDDAQQDGTNDVEVPTEAKEEKDDKKHLFQIPLNLLPCPEELRDATDSPSPSQGEVKDYRNKSSFRSSSPVVFFTALLFVILVVRVHS